MTNLLLDEPPLVVQRGLIRRCGNVLDALVCQQLNYWSERATQEHDGHVWVYKTYDEWGAELGVTAKMARGALDRLRDLGFVVALQNPKDSRDRTLWWRVDAEAVESGAPSASGGTSGDPGSGAPASSGSSSHASGGGSETTSETTPESAGEPAQEEVVQHDPNRPSLLPQDEDKDPARMVDEAAALRVLREVPRANGSPAPTLEAVEKVHDRHPALGMEVLARELEFWATHGNGARRKVKSVMGTFATFAKRAQQDVDAAAASQSPGSSVPSGGDDQSKQDWDRPDWT